MKKHSDTSSISQTESKMIEEISGMRKREVNKVMVPTNEIVALSYDQTLQDAIVCFQQYFFSRYPVYFSNLDQIVGVLYIKDILAFWHEYKKYPVVEFVRFPHFVYEDRSALDVFLELQRLRLSLGIVIDEFGGVSGIITTEDLIEEIVGDIEDEFDKRKKSFIEKVSANEYIVNTRMELDDFAEYHKIKIDEHDISTVGGLVVKVADRIPQKGEEVSYKKLKFTVLDGTKRRITRVKVTKK